MYEILIVSSKDKQALPWVKYFYECFEKCNIQRGRPCPKILPLELEDITTSHIDSELQTHITNVKLQLLIVCPTFLELIEERPEVYTGLTRLFKPDRLIAMLLGVTDETLTEIHHLVLTNYTQWQRHIAGEDQDENFAKNFLASAFNIQTKVVREEQRLAREERTTFSVMPKKVKKSQNRLIILLMDPLTPEDKTKVSVDKNGELIEIKSVKRCNPYTLKFSMPECCLEMSLMVNVVVEKNGDLLGMRPVKCESRLRELDQILRTSANPLEFMCQSLGFNPSHKDQLDNFLVQNFQRNLPPNFSLLSSKGQIVNNPCKFLHNQEEFPTLLHFAAKYGLEKLALQLVECPGADVAIDSKNINDMTPSEMAEKNGHNCLASMLNGYMKMNEFSQIYSTLNYMAHISEKVNDDTLDYSDYLEPRKVGADSLYLIPPPARPVESNNGLNQIGYIDMVPNKCPSSNKGTLKKNKSQDSGFNSNTNSLPKDANRIKPYEDKAQKELSEILNDFKHEIHTMPEVEQFVNSWRNSTNVIESFALKQEQLKHMQEEYEKVQKKLLEKKGVSPFDRFKKIFQRSKKVVHVEREETHSVNSQDQSSLRRISNLSLQSTTSTSSSGRMSTISASSVASFGDSGTHSDNEERKNLIRQSSNASEQEYTEIPDKFPIDSNYMIPPAPKPVIKLLTRIPNIPQIPTIIEKPSFSGLRDENQNKNEQYYIQFPSNLPIHSNLTSRQKSTTPEPLPPPPPELEYLNIDVGNDSINEYMNFNVTHQFIESQKTTAETQENEELDSFNETDPLNYVNTEQLPEYMNFKPQMTIRK